MDYVDKKEDYERNKSDRSIIEDLFYIEKNYDKTIIEIKSFLNKINSDSIKCVYDFWFVYNMLGRTYAKQKLYAHAIKNLQIASKYKVEDFYSCTSIWLLGNIYEKVDNKGKAILMYEKCLEYYTLIEANEYILYLKFNVAKLENSSETIEQLIIDYKRMNIDKSKYFDKDENLIEMYETLYNIYNKNKNHSKIINLIHNIENKQLRQKILKSQKVLVAI